MTLAADTAPSLYDELDPTIRPQDDLWGHVNQRWYDATEIPSHRPATSPTWDSAELERDRLAELCAQLGTEDHPHGSPQQQIGALFAQYSDVERRDRIGATPLAPDMAVIADVTTVDALLRACGEFNRSGVTTILADELVNDVADPTRYQLMLWQSGLTLPDEAYYREEQHAELRNHLPQFVDTLLAECAEVLPGGVAPADAGRRILAFETHLASHHWDAVRTREIDAILNPMTIAQMSSLSGAPWEAYFEGEHAPAAVGDNLVVGQPSYLEGVGAMLREVDLSEWLLWLTWRVVCSRATLLHTGAYEAAFDFLSRRIRGAQEPDAMGRRAVAQCSAILPLVIGRVYVEAFTSPQVKDAVREIMEDCRAAMGEAIQGCSWMSAQSKAAADVKLRGMTFNVAYPDAWIDFSHVDIRPGDLVGNARRAASGMHDLLRAKVGGPVDPNLWDMPPHIVNACYNPFKNDLTFPAAALRVPWFDLSLVDGDPARNYGALGTVVGHEMGHGFDDQGAKFDEIGRRRDWWTADDEAAFAEIGKVISADFARFKTRNAPDGPYVNGDLCLGENIADIFGAAVGLNAYRRALARKPVPDTHGYTAEQRFFLASALMWRSKYSSQLMEMVLAMDPHAPDDVRGNSVRHLDEFHDAFGTKEGDGMWLAPEDRRRIF